MMPPDVRAKVEKIRGECGLKRLGEVEQKGDWTEWKTYCRVCGETLKEMIPSDEHRVVREIKGKTIVYERLFMAHTNMYQEIEMKMDKGGPHITTVCKTCAPKLTIEQLEELYTSDLHSFEADEQAGKGKVPWSVFEGRKPVGYRIV